MAIEKITYENKVAINTDSTIPAINKCQATDLNEIKEVVNNNADEMPTKDNLVNVGTSVDTNYRTNILISKNLLDISTMENGYIDNTGNIIIGNNENICSDYIKVNSGSDYTISLNTQYNNIGYALFNSSKTYISRQNNNNKQTLTITIPSGTEYIRVWFNKNSQTITKEIITQNEPQIELGDTRTTYEAIKLNTINVDSNKFSDTINVGTTIDTRNRVNVLYSQNLWDKSSILWFKNNNTSTFDDRNDNNTTRIKSTPISIQGGKTYTISGLPSGITLNTSGVACYDKNKTYLGSNYAPYTNGTFTLPSNVVYIAIMCNGENFTSETNTLMNNADIMLNEGNTALPYEPYIVPSINIDGDEIYNANLMNYSTDEIRIGTWLGKPLYRKVVDFGLLPNATSKTVSSGLTASTTRITKIEGVARDNTSGYCIPIPHSNTNSAGGGVQMEFNTNGEIFIRTQANYSTLNGYITFEYTKTTD